MSEIGCTLTGVCILNGGVACVCAEWSVFVHFCAFVLFLCVSVLLLLPKWAAKKREFAQNSAKSAFMQNPL